jgi:hypothetical protein
MKENECDSEESDVEEEECTTGDAATSKRKVFHKWATLFYESIRRNRDDLRKFEHYQQSISKFRECRQKYFPLWGLASSGGSKGSKTSKRDKKQLGVWMDGY